MIVANQGVREMDDKRYEEIGTNYRFFLGWRHASFAGDLVIIYGVLSLTLSIYKDMPSIAWIIPAIGCPVGVLLWIIDVRTRELYHAAIRAGKDLEGMEGGFFTQLSIVAVPKGSSPFKKKTQSAALNLLFIGSSVFLFILAIGLFIMAH
jgi:hypothetical protein